MLVLSRKTSDSLLIGKDIEVVVVEIRGNTVRLGVKAPDDVKVLRGEIAGQEQEAP